MLTLTVVSDLHLEGRPLDLDDVIDPTLSADVLALLGDIGDPATDVYSDFIRQCAARFRTVLLLAGNNEYRNSMGRTMAETEELIRRRIAPYPNVRFLQNDIHLVKNVCFVGSTLWSFIPEDIIPLPEPAPRAPRATAAAPAADGANAAAAQHVEATPKPAANAVAPAPVAGPSAASAAAACELQPPAQPSTSAAAAAHAAPTLLPPRNSSMLDTQPQHEDAALLRRMVSVPVAAPGAVAGRADLIKRSSTRRLELPPGPLLPIVVSAASRCPSTLEAGLATCLLRDGSATPLELLGVSLGSVAQQAAAMGHGGRHRHSHHHPGHCRAHRLRALLRRTVSLSALPPDAPCPPVFAPAPEGSREGSSDSDASALSSSSASDDGSISSDDAATGASSRANGTTDSAGSSRAPGQTSADVYSTPVPASAVAEAAAVAMAARLASDIAASAEKEKLEEAQPAAATVPLADAQEHSNQHQQHHHRHHHQHHHNEDRPHLRRMSSASATTTTTREYCAATSLDFRRIYRTPGGPPITPDDTNTMFVRSVEYIQRAVAAARAQGLQPVVLTHHAPSIRGTSHPRFAGHPATHLYATNLEPLMRGSGIAAWYCGHTHFNHDAVMHGGVRLASNQFGSQAKPAEGYSRTWKHHLPTSGVPESPRATGAERGGALSALLRAHGGLSGPLLDGAGI